MVEVAKRLDPGKWFAAGNVLVALVTAFVAFGLVPGRSPWVDVPAITLMAALVASSVGLALEAGGLAGGFTRRLARGLARLVRPTALAVLAAGVVLAASATLGATFANAVASVDAGPGRLLPVLALVLILPYFILYPLGQLMWLAARAAGGPRA
jgi:hypothetical protein